MRAPSPDANRGIRRTAPAAATGVVHDDLSGGVHVDPHGLSGGRRQCQVEEGQLEEAVGG